jgi:hypothetical protein
MSKKTEQPKIREDEFVDPSNMAALEEALQPARGEFPLSLPSGKKIIIPFQIMGFAGGMEASRGERFKENEVNDPDKTRRIYTKKINSGLLEGWHIVDDLSRKIGSPAQLLSQRKIPISIIRTEDWNALNESIFPGAISTPESIQDRANAIRDQSVPIVSSPGDSEPGSD